MSGEEPKEYGRLTLGEHVRLGEERESWCAVEMRAGEYHLRTTRKHYDHAYDSFEFGYSEPEPEPRLQWPKEHPSKDAERRHFPQEHNMSHIKI